MWLIIVSAALLLVALACVVIRRVTDPEHGKWPVIVGSAALALILGFHAWCCFGSVPSGSVGVPVLFGRVQHETTYEAGMYVKNPYATVQLMSIQRREVKRSSANGGKSEQGFVVVQSSDELSLDVDVTLPYALNPRYAGRVFAAVGSDDVYHSTMVQSAASHAVREGYVTFRASEAYGLQRERVAEKITDVFHQRLVGQLRPLPLFSDLTDEELKSVFIPIPVQLEKTVPPDRVRTAIAENKAALLELERQETLNKIAEKEALRREQEGTGISKFLAGLPQGTSTDRAIELLNASANMERAKAFKVGVETGKLTMVYITDGGRTPVAVSGDPKK